MIVKLHVTVKNIKFQHCHVNATVGSLVALKRLATKHVIHLSTIQTYLGLHGTDICVKF
jgi:hypothetical protein